MKKLFFIYIAFGCLGSCSLIEDPEEITIVNIGTDYFLEVSQKLSQGPNPFQIDISSIDKDHCQNSSISLSTIHHGQDITLNLKDIIDPAKCIPLEESVKAEVDLNLEVGLYNINVSLKDITQNRGILEVTGERFKMELETENGIVVLRQEIQIIPDGYFWGQFKINDIQDLSSVKSFLIELQKEHLDNDLNDGNYGYFELKGGHIVFDAEEVGSLVENFIFKEQHSFLEVRKTVSDFNERHPSIDIELFHSSGDRL